MVNGWTPTSLGDILTQERRPVVLDPEKKYAEIGVYSYGRGIFHKEPRTGFEVGDKDLYEIKQGDFIFQITFAWEGAIALASESEDGMYGSVRFPTYRVNEEICDPKFLLNYFKTEEGRREVGRISPGSAGRNRVLATKRLPEIFVPLPPLTEQRRIVAHIESLAARVNEAQRLREEAKIEVEAVLAASMNNVFDFSKLNTHLGDYITVISGYGFPSGDYVESGTHQILRIGNVRDGYLDLSRSPIYWNFDGDKRIGKVELQEGDIVISMTGTRNKRDYGYVAIVPAKSKLLLNQRLGKIIPKTDIDTKYLFYFLRSPFFKDRLFPQAKGTANQANISNNHIECVQFGDLPPLNEQRRIVAYLDGLQTKVHALRELQVKSGEELSALMPSVLDRAFKGEL